MNKIISILNNIISILSIIIISIIFVIVFAKTLDRGIRDYEKNECLQWQNDSKIYDRWYSTDWQREQCRRYGIILKRGFEGTKKTKPEGLKGEW